ncbi:hypothetical protein HanIR_Chr13g0668061 [Helianthus annuus]|nr:hypothetical protein HanIR_Chr13g0668061 [Helianthus annuus]
MKSNSLLTFWVKQSTFTFQLQLKIAKKSNTKFISFNLDNYHFYLQLELINRKFRSLNHNPHNHPRCSKSS